jgi:hypothetical protein
VSHGAFPATCARPASRMHFHEAYNSCSFYSEYAWDFAPITYIMNSVFVCILNEIFRIGLFTYLRELPMESMISSWMVIECRTTNAMVEQSWVQSQHLTTEWNLRGGRWSSVQQCMEYSSKRNKKKCCQSQQSTTRLGFILCKNTRSKISPLITHYLI